MIIMRFIKKYLVFIVGIIMLSFFIYGRYQIKVKDIKNIKANFALTEGKIIQFREELVRNSIPIQYDYTVNSKKYKNSFLNQEPCKNLNKLDMKKLKQIRFPVAYSTKNYKLSRILIRPKDFNEFDLPFPDSLNRIYSEYFKECEDNWIDFRWY